MFGFICLGVAMLMLRYIMKRSSLGRVRLEPEDASAKKRDTTPVHLGDNS